MFVCFRFIFYICIIESYSNRGWQKYLLFSKTKVKLMKKLYLGLVVWLFVVPVFAQDTDSDKNNATTNQEESASLEQIKGSVKGTDGEPLVGATVIIKGTTNGTTADADGNYRLKAAKGDVLVASYIGTFTSEVTYTGQAQIDFVLQTDITSLEEIIIVGYGTQKKADVTGAISLVDMEELNKRQVATVDQALQGQVAGVDVTSSSGTPGRRNNDTYSWHRYFK